MRILAVALTLFCCQTVWAVDHDSTQLTNNRLPRWYRPSHVPLQFAGNIGLLSAGVGFSSRSDDYRLALVYGYVPASLSVVRVHMLTMKNSFRLATLGVNRNTSVTPYLSAGVSWEIKGRSFFSQPDVMPDQYYRFPKSIRLVPGAGVRVKKEFAQKKFFTNTEFFAEATTYDILVFYKVYSREIRLNQIFSAAIGVNFFF